MSILKVIQENRCIGCELCIMECQRQLKRVGLSGSYVRILRDLREGDVFKVSFDPRIVKLKVKKIAEVCPRQVFEETENSGA